jgi:hypothetical protein
MRKVMRTCLVAGASATICGGMAVATAAVGASHGKNRAATLIAKLKAVEKAGPEAEEPERGARLVEQRPQGGGRESDR